MDILNWSEFLLPYQQTVDELCVKVNNLRREFTNSERHSPIESVEGRVKRPGSILEKANRKNIPYGKVQDKIEDIAGIRIICRFVEDIEKVAALIRIRSGYDLKIIEERDYITHTKPSGYRSYHILAKYSLVTSEGVRKTSVEIQIRTLAMNFWATIEHSLRYKYSGNIPDDLQKRLISSAEAAFLLDREMSVIRDEIMESQLVIQRKNDLVDQILRNLQTLYTQAHAENCNDLNKQFLILYEEGSLEKLSEFNNRLKIIAQIYKVQNE